MCWKSRSSVAAKVILAQNMEVALLRWCVQIARRRICCCGHAKARPALAHLRQHCALHSCMHACVNVVTSDCSYRLYRYTVYIYHTLHYITLHFLTLHYITLHYTTYKNYKIWHFGTYIGILRLTCFVEPQICDEVREGCNKIF